MNRDLWLTIKNQIELSKINGPTLFIFIIDIFLLLTSWNLFQLGSFFVIISYLFASLALLQFYLILHEATHNAVSTSNFINSLIGHLCGFLVLMPYLPRQSSHILHHTWTGHPVRDPANNRMIQKFSVITEKDIMRLETIWKYWIPAIIINDRVGLWLSPHKIKKSGQSTQKIQKELFWNKIYLLNYFLILAVVIRLGHLGTFSLWLIPSLFIAFIIEELVNLPHHAETPLVKPTDKAIPYWEQHKVTHSCQSIPFWSNYIILNFNLHVAHHFFPTASWNLLTSLDKKIQNNLSEKSNDQINEFSWSIKNRPRPLMSLMGHYFNQANLKKQTVNSE